MYRRTVLASIVLLIEGTIAVVSSAGAERVDKGFRIGVLGAGSAAQYAKRMAWFRQELESLGWVQERGITFEERWADGHYERLASLATELIALRVELIFVTGGTPAVEAALKATREIPIVFSGLGDPVGQRIVPSIGRPGGNATGVSIVARELYAKRLELLKEAVPRMKRVALLLNGANDFSTEALRSARSASQALGIELHAFDTREFQSLESVFKAMSQAGVEGAIIGSDPVLNDNIKQLGVLALRYQVPLTTTTRGVDVGVLMSYHADIESLYRGAAGYVDKILRGAKPADLPIQQPNKFLLVINLKTAKALGLTIPQSVLLRADELIQ